MQTRFLPEALAEPAMRRSEEVIRKCVHCGFCTATCPTYVLLGDELDSPRGRIYLIKDMLENQREPSAEMVKHVDRCLSCLSCMTTCPSGVNYMHLVDHARAYIHERYERPWIERLVRSILAFILPHPRRFRAALALARLGRPLRNTFARLDAARPIKAMLDLAPRRVPHTAPAHSARLAASLGRVALLQGCAEPVLRPEFRAAAVRLINRCGRDVIFARDEGCCGALVHHMGREDAALAAARRNVDAWMAEIEGEGLDAIIVTASGCGTTIKNYGLMLRHDPDYAEKAAQVSGLARDITEYIAQVGLPSLGAGGVGEGVAVAYHPACSLQHGQRVTEAPRRLLAQAGFDVRVPVDAHLCCGSAGTYNILQPAIADELGRRKAAAIDRLHADVIATGNIGCATQIGRFVGRPVVHTVELLDWATGGPKPPALCPVSED